ncbi:protein translocase subunit SecF [Candidatus Woesearchaeota archaeon]|nr:protein translocase subunit SecF [Candidatus Woesearchaeota archaeon]
MALSRRERREQRWKANKETRLEQLKNIGHGSHVLEKKEYKGILGIYDRHYLKLLWIPMILLVIALGLFVYQIATTGDFINKGVSLKGGVVITVPVETPVDLTQVSSLLKAKFSGDEIDVRSTNEFGVQKALIVLTDNIDANDAILEELDTIIPGASENASSETTGAALGGSFFSETIKAMIFAFVFMGIVVFFSFRAFMPSLMVILSVFADIIETIVVVNLLGMKISGAGIAALLMLIGYSVDTDILLTTRVLKSKEGTVFQRTLNAANTGIMLTTTALIAVTVSLFFTQSEVIKEIMIIMLIGLLFDLVNTWLQNTALLRYYMERILPRRMAAREGREEAHERRVDKVAEEVEDEMEAEENEEGGRR